MFCKDGLQKDEKGCDKCSCVRGTGKLATGVSSCQRDSHGCCSELGMAWCPDQNFCVSTRPDAVIPCKSWGNTPPVTAASATVSVSGFGVSGSGAVSTTNGATSTVFGSSTSSSTLKKVAQPSASSGLSSAVTTPASPRVSCPDVMCTLYCPNGFQKDFSGCNKCACAGLGNGQCASVDCGDTTCSGGFSKDSQGCPTCICLAGAVSPSRTSTQNTRSTGSSRLSASVTGSSGQPDSLIAIDRPAVALNPCLSSPCRSNYRCVPSPKQCIQAPCPQYTCVKKGRNGQN